jgi:hypothetical protein
MIERKTVRRRIGRERFEVYAAAAWRVVADDWIWLFVAAVLAGDLVTGQVVIGIVVLISAVVTAGITRTCRYARRPPMVRAAAAPPHTSGTVVGPANSGHAT